MASKKAVICIDNGYFNKLCSGFKRKRTSFKKFTDYIAQQHKLKEFKVYIYDCMPYQSKIPTKGERERYSNKDKFFSAMRGHGFITRFGKLQKLGKSDFKQKKVDTLWTADISKLAYTKEIDTVIIISGDSDFVPGVQIAKDLGIKTILWFGDSKFTTTSYELRNTCDEINRITPSILGRCQM